MRCLVAGDGGVPSGSIDARVATRITDRTLGIDTDSRRPSFDTANSVEALATTSPASGRSTHGDRDLPTAPEVDE